MKAKKSASPPHFRSLFLLIVETLLWRSVICDLFVNSQKDGCLLVFFVGYQVRGLFQKWRFGLKNYNSITIFPSMLWNRRSRCLPSVGHLFQDHSRTIITFCLQNCFQCYEMAFFIGYQVEGCFSSVKVQKSSICSLTSESFNRPVLHKRYFCNSQPGHNEDGVAEMPMVRCKPAAGRFPTPREVEDQYGRP